MAKVIPFKAVKPTTQNVAMVASNPFQSYSQQALQNILNSNPYSFLHIIAPSPNHLKGKKHYNIVKQRYQSFKKEGILVQDKTPSYYVYKIEKTEGLSFSGIIAAASTDDYKNNIIKKHEDTIEFRENMFKNHLKTVGFNAEPVLLTYPDNKVIDQLVGNAQKTAPEFKFTSPENDKHYLWKISDKTTIASIKQEFNSIKVLYIADGHHRSASSTLLAEHLKARNKAHTGNEAYNYFMSFLIPESNLRIYEYNKLVKDLNGFAKPLFLSKLSKHFKIENKGHQPYGPLKKHSFGMYLDGQYYVLHLRKDQCKFNNALDALDPQILYKTVLKPILGISDLRNDTRIGYSHGKNSGDVIKKKIDHGEFAVGFCLAAITVNELKAIANQGLTMPPKSTFIQPKLLSGVSIYEL